MTHHAEKNFSQKLTLFAVLSFLGLLLNALAPELFPGFNYLPGSITVFLAIRLLGPFWAFAVAVIVSSYVIVLFGHANAMIWLSLEALVVGCVVRYTRFKNLFLVDLLYWPLIGNVILWVIFKQVLNVPTPGTIGAMLMFWLIGMNNALLAEIILNFTPLKQWLNSDKEQASLRLQDFLFFSMTGLFWLLAFSIAIVNGNTLIKKGKAETLTALHNTGEMVRKVIESQPLIIEDEELFDHLFQGYKHRESNFTISIFDGQGKLLRSNQPEKAEDILEFRTTSLPDGVDWLTPVTKQKLPKWRVVQLSILQKSYPLTDDYQLSVEFPFAYVQSQVIRITTNSLIVLILVNILMMIVVRQISASLSNKISQLSTISNGLPEKIFQQKELSWPSSSLFEVQQITSNFIAMSDALSDKFTTLKNSNEQMEETVRQRTFELQNKNDELLQEMRAREESEEKFRMLVESTSTIPWELDFETERFTYVGQQISSILGVSPSSWQTLDDWAEMIHPDDREEAISFCQTQSAQGLNHHFEYRMLTAQGDIRWLLDDVAVITENGKPVKLSGFIHDITLLKKQEEQRLELEEQLRQKYKMEAVGVLAGGMAHNFNNNLSIILGNIELAQLEAADAEPLKKYLDNSKTALLRSRDLIKKIMLFSRQEPHEKKVIQPALVIEETLKLLESTIPSSVELSIDVSQSGKDAMIMADATRLQEALINLCTNAVHAMDEVGRLVLNLDVVTLESQEIPVQQNSLPGHYLLISFKDTGVGIPAENIDKIFDPFFTTKEVDEGTGMGLSTVRGFIEAHNGFIKVESSLNVGTTFKLYIPTIESESLEQEKQEQLLLRGSEKILFVDDEEMLASLGGAMLATIGYQVKSVTRPEEALKLIEEDPAFYDLVITDQTMPGLTGTELTKLVKKIRPDMPVILCTGFSSHVGAEDAGQFGIDAFCMKPLEMTELSSKIRQCLD